MAARSETEVCGGLLSRIVSSKPPGSWMSVVSVVCCQVEVSVSGRSLVQRIPTEFRVSECDNEACSIMRRPWPTSGCCFMKNNSLNVPINNYTLNTLNVGNKRSHSFRYF